MGLYHNLPLFDDDDNVNVIIEVSKGSKAKYEFNKEHNVIALDRILHTPIAFPYSYGFLPQTWNDDDHDPLDAVVVSSEALMPGAIVPCRVIGYMEVVDRGEKDDKVLCVPAGDPFMKTIKSHADLQEKLKEDYVYFMNHYKDLENKKVEFKSWRSVAEAKKLLARCKKAYVAKGK